jgi:UDP-N-acetylglucosamine 2-epimerase (non-hydrolysing)
VHILLVAGARPNFMKVAPIVRALRARGDRFSTTLVHTGQHYDAAMSDVFFEQLGIPRPDVHLEVGSASHAQQTAAIMSRFEPVLVDRRPDLVAVVGDVNSTLACALVASKLRTPVAHVEAGLRSYDREMPEEINRVLTDQVSDLLFTTERGAEDNLAREGVARDKVHFVGNVMIDTLLAHRDRAAAAFDPAAFDVRPGAFGLMTLHRPSNVDRPAAFERLMQGLAHVAADVPLLFPVHPRTRPALSASPFASRLVAANRLRLLDPIGYFEFLGAMTAARVVVTDSGGVQEETTVLGVPCLTLRENTERPVTISEGTNTLVGTSPERIIAAWNRVRDNPPPHRIPELWDGKASERIADVLARYSSLMGPR